MPLSFHYYLHWSALIKWSSWYCRMYGTSGRYKRPQACHLTVYVVRFSKPWHIKLEELWRDTFLLWEDRSFFFSWETHKMGHEVLHSACSHASDIAWLNILFYSSCVRKMHIIYTIPRLIKYARYHLYTWMFFCKRNWSFTERKTQQSERLRVFVFLLVLKNQI